MEFLDGPESDTEGPGTAYGQEKARLLQEKVGLAARRADEDDRAHRGRRTAGGRRPDRGSGGQSGELLQQGVPVWHDEHGPYDSEHDRRGAEAHQRERIRAVRELPGGDATKTAGSGAVGHTLHQLPGKGRARVVVSSAAARGELRCFTYRKVHSLVVYSLKWSRLPPAWRRDSPSRNA